MKTIQKEKIEKSYYNVYVANDGTEFRNEEECKKYDESALGVLMVRYKEILVFESCEYGILDYGSEDCTMDVVKPRGQDDADLIMQIFLLNNSYLTDSRSDTINTTRKLVLRAVEEDDYLLICRGYENDGFWPQDTRNSMKEKLDKFFTSKENDD